MHMFLGTLFVDAVLEKARAAGSSMTNYLAVILGEALNELRDGERSPLNRRLPPKLMVSMDLRRRFESVSLRNFSLYGFGTFRDADRERPFSERLKLLEAELKAQSDMEYLKSMMAASADQERKALLRHAPLFIKRLAIRFGSGIFGECCSSMTFSNLGPIRLPKAMEERVERIDCLLYPRIRSSYNCGLLSYGDKLYIIFSRRCKEPVLERIFFRKLWELGLSLELEEDGKMLIPEEFLKPGS